MGEMKFFDASGNGATTTSWVVTSSNLYSTMAKGTTSSTRVGIKIRIHSLNFKVFVDQVTSEGQGAPQDEILTRVIVGINSDGGAATAAEIMDTTGTNQILAWRNLAFTRQYRILKDMYFFLKPVVVNEGAQNLFAAGVTVTPVQIWTHNFKKPLEGTFDIASDTVTRNSLFVAVVSTKACVLRFESRVRYTDS